MSWLWHHLLRTLVFGSLPIRQVSKVNRFVLLRELNAPSHKRSFRYAKKASMAHPCEGHSSVGSSTGLSSVMDFIDRDLLLLLARPSFGVVLSRTGAGLCWDKEKHK
jgi:hypothetical protein